MLQTYYHAGKVEPWHPQNLDKSRLPDDVTNAVQKDDIRQLIEEGVIKARPLVGNSRGRARKAEAQSQGA